MTQLPESGLETLAVTDHVSHHEDLHAMNNRLLSTTSEPGDVLMRFGTGATLANFQPAQTDFTHASQTRIHYHYAAGPLTFDVGSSSLRAIKVEADSNITGLSVTNLDLRGAEFAWIWVLLSVITQTITIDLSGGGTTPPAVIGGAPATMSPGDEVPFILQRWNIT